MSDFTALDTCHFGDCREIMAEMLAAGVRVQTVVTSPPYWGLRDYGTRPLIFGGLDGCAHSWGVERVQGELRTGRGQAAAAKKLGGAGGHKQARIPKIESERATCITCGAWRGHLGLEALHDCMAWARSEPPCSSCYVCHIRAVFRLVFDLLAKDGTLWLNIGDSYTSGGRSGNPTHASSTLRGGLDSQEASQVQRHLKPPRGLKSKELCGIPYRVGMALQADGWFWRSAVIWHKPNAMPESVTDRPTRAHEYLWLFSKSPRYYYDHKAIQESAAPATVARLRQRVEEQRGSDRVPGKTNGPMKAVGDGETRNKKNVWTVATQGYSGAHFATFPEKLVEPCILAGSKGGGHRVRSVHGQRHRG